MAECRPQVAGFDYIAFASYFTMENKRFYIAYTAKETQLLPSVQITWLSGATLFLKRARIPTAQVELLRSICESVPD